MVNLHHIHYLLFEAFLSRRPGWKWFLVLQFSALWARKLPFSALFANRAKKRATRAENGPNRAENGHEQGRKWKFPGPAGLKIAVLKTISTPAA